MIPFIFLLSCIALFSAAYAILTIRRTKKQIAEMTEALADIRNGNGNRRILALPHELTAPLVYEINDIIVSYEERLSAFYQMEEANKQLMTSLSHDVRTPLTTLIGYLDALCREPAAGGEQTEYLENARRKARDLKEYIDVLFDWFKLTSNEFTLNPQTAELAELTRTILIDWIPVLEENKLEYVISVPDAPFPVLFDADCYTRILGNLMQNVILHSRATRIELSLTSSEGCALLELSDNGVGIEKEDLKHIFDRLYKCDKGRTAKGSGLGLSIACQLTEKMGGKITAKSAPGRGCAFTLSFPLA
jgi:Signal transduction histidine kinase